MKRAFIGLALLVIACCAWRPHQYLERVYVGTYKAGGGRGIYLVDFDLLSGRFASEPVLAAESENPSFLAIDPKGRFLLAVNELQHFNGEASGALSAFHVDSLSGRLSLINQQPSGGTDPCFVSLDAQRRHALVANYTSGTVAVLPVDDDGRLQPASSVRTGSGSGPVRDRQKGPHAHQILLDPSKRFALWTDLGADFVAVDRYDAAGGMLEPATPPGIKVPPGSGPRHLAWHPLGKVAYLLNELSSTVTKLSFDPDSGALRAAESISARRSDAGGQNTAAEIVIPGLMGHFVYTSNRGDDDVAVFRVDPFSFELEPSGHASTGGRTPRHIAFDMGGMWMIAANQTSNSLVAFRIDPSTGIPAPTGSTVTVPSPVNVVFAPSVKAP